MDLKVKLAVLLFYLCLPILAAELEKFSTLNVQPDSDVKTYECFFTKSVGESESVVGICGHVGRSCSIAVYRNQTEANIHRDTDCSCYRDVFPMVDQSESNTPGNLTLDSTGVLN